MTDHRQSIRFLIAALSVLSGAADTSDADPPTIIPTAAVSCRTLKVIDGDTLRLTCDGPPFTARLYCIDAPELGQTIFGDASRKNLARIVKPELKVLEVKRDLYGRSIVQVFDPDTGTDLSRRQVQDGQAAVYHGYCTDPAFQREEATAKARGFGLWRVPGCQQTPWSWRSKQCVQDRSP